MSSMIFAADLDSTKTLVEIKDLDSLEVKTDSDTLMLQKKGMEPVLGVVMNNDLNFETAKRKQWNEKYGALVSWVTTGSAAEEYGIQDGDIITNFDGQKVMFNDHLRKLIKTKQAGDSVEVVIFRDGKFYKTNVILGAKQESKEVYPSVLIFHITMTRNIIKKNETELFMVKVAPVVSIGSQCGILLTGLISIIWQHNMVLVLLMKI